MLSLEYLAQLLVESPASAKARVAEFSLNGRHFAFNSQPAVMGVVNLSPDSWYRESVCLNTQMAVRRAKTLAAQGADIVDVGAESTLAHAARLDQRGQQSKLLPVVKELTAAGLLVSVETYEKTVAEAALAAGAKVVNLTGMEQAADVYSMAADHGAAVIVCYVEGKNVREVGDIRLENVLANMRDYFARQIELAAKRGLERIMIDPGLGFYYRNLGDSAIRVRHQMATFLQTFRLRELGFPVCHALPHAFEYFGDQVRCAEPFFAVLAALGKTDLFRTHEVPRVKAVLDTMKLL